MTGQRHLVIFARYPQAGSGKRRLATGVGAIEALRFQRIRLKVLIARHGRDPRWLTWLAVTPDRSGPWPAHVRRLAQGGGDLGRRMERVIEMLPRGPAVIIGTDIPGISSMAIVRAFEALGDHDAVFGPAGDGGYWLFGLSQSTRSRRPFSNVRWSSEHALADTLCNFAGRPVALINRLDDVDDVGSLRDQPHWGRLCVVASSGRSVALNQKGDDQ